MPNWTQVEAGRFSLGDDASQIALKGQEEGRLSKQKSLQDQALQSFLLGKKAEMEQAEQARNISTLKGLMEDPQLKDRSVSVGGGGSVGVGGRPMDALLKVVDDERLETQGVRNAYEKMIGDTRSKAQVLREAEGLLSSPNPVTYGQLKNTLARLKEKGAMTEGDIARTMPPTLRSTVSGIGSFLGVQDVNPLDPDIKKQVGDYLSQLRSEHENRLSGSKRELEQQAPFMAPTLHKTGKLPQVMQSLGSGIEQQPTEDPKTKMLQDAMRKIEALEAKKAASGAR